MGIVNTVSTVTYNGITIDDILKSTVRAVPIYNNQGTTVKYIEYQIEIEAIVYPTSFDLIAEARPSTDNPLELIRTSLLQSGKPLQFRDRGFGKLFQFNTTPNNHTVDWGPKPQILLYETMGGFKAARVVWAITARQAECIEGGGSYHSITEFWVTSSIKINKSGYQTLTRKGYIEKRAKPGTGGISKGFRGFVYRLLGPESMAGYHLEQDYVFSPDDLSCEFTLTYTEIESDNVYPSGVVDIECNHAMGSKLLAGDPFAVGFKRWTNTMDCTIKLRPEVPKVQAWAIFGYIASERINQGIPDPITRWILGELITEYKIPIILSLEIRESMFANEVSFSVKWVSTVDAIKDAIRAAGMFKPVTSNTSWLLWTTDIRNNAQNPDGAYPLLEEGNSNSENPKTSCSASVEYNIPQSSRAFREPIYIVGVFDNDCPPEDQSWIDMQNAYYVNTKEGRKVFNRYRNKDQVRRGYYNPDTKKTSVELDQRHNQDISGADFFEQDFGNDDFTITMKGYAIRLGYPTNPPQHDVIGGKKVKQLDNQSHFSSRVMSSFGNCPVIVTTWEITYAILGTPEGDLEGRGKEGTGEPGYYQ